MKRDPHPSEKSHGVRLPFRVLALEQFETRVALDASGLTSHLDCGLQKEDSTTAVESAHPMRQPTMHHGRAMHVDSAPEGEWSPPEGVSLQPEGEGPVGEPATPNQPVPSAPIPTGNVGATPPIAQPVATPVQVPHEAPHSDRSAVVVEPSVVEPSVRSEGISDNVVRATPSSVLPPMSRMDMGEGEATLGGESSSWMNATSHREQSSVASSLAGASTSWKVREGFEASISSKFSDREVSGDAGLMVSVHHRGERPVTVRSHASFDRPRSVPVLGWTQVGGVDLVAGHVENGGYQFDRASTLASASVGTYQLFAIGSNELTEAGTEMNAFATGLVEESVTWDSRAWLSDFLGLEEGAEDTAGGYSSRLFLSGSVVIGGVVWLISQQAVRHETKRGAVTGHLVTTPLRSI